MCCWHQKQQIIPLRFFEALDPYADGIKGGRKFRCGFLKRLIHAVLASEAIGNSAAVFEALFVQIDVQNQCAAGIRNNRKFRCGFLKRLIHALLDSETTENSAAVFLGIWIKRLKKPQRNFFPPLMHQHMDQSPQKTAAAFSSASDASTAWINRLKKPQRNYLLFLMPAAHESIA